MTDAERIQAMMVAAQALTDRAKTDPAVAEALLADAGKVIASLLEGPLPQGAVFSAARGEDGEIELSLEMDAPDGEIEGELGDDALDGVAGGRSLFGFQYQVQKV